ncbi:MAG: hypothetical protein F4061_06135 [Acidobacteria bacterium]|nr:hypothetical protein [Acidobacteriota bacterium]
MHLDLSKTSIELLRDGPLAPVGIGPAKERLTTVHALIDTGADSSFVSTRLVTELSLIRCDELDRTGADVHGPQTWKVVEAHIEMGRLGIPSPRRFAVYPNPMRKWDVVVGRDILQLLDMVYEGPRGMVLLGRPGELS